MAFFDINGVLDPFVIAEVGGNHEGEIGFAKELACQAVESGAHAVKFQAYSPDRIVSRLESPVRNQHFGRFALSAEQYVELAECVRAMGAQFMASVWDEEYLRLLDPYIEIHKIGSGDLTNLPLVKALVLTNKPLIASTAMCTMNEVYEFINFVDEVNPELRSSGRLCVMHCVAMYGDPIDKYANLLAIRTLQEKMPPDVVAGYSDHTCGTVAIMAAYCMGTKVIEIHFTNDQTREFRDHQFSKTQQEILEFLAFCKRFRVMSGTGIKAPMSAIETPERIREFRRAVYFSRDVAAGTVATEENLTTLRPCVGIDAREYYAVLGKRLLVDKRCYERIEWEDFETSYGNMHGDFPIRREDKR